MSRKSIAFALFALSACNPQPPGPGPGPNPSPFDDVVDPPACAITAATSGSSSSAYLKAAFQDPTVPQGTPFYQVHLSRGAERVLGVASFTNQTSRLALWQRGNPTPLVTFGSLTAATSSGTFVVSSALAKGGQGFVIATNDGRIQYFECDQSAPKWTYQDPTPFNGRSVQAVAITDDSRYIVALKSVTGETNQALLFSRDSELPIAQVILPLPVANRIAEWDATPPAAFTPGHGPHVGPDYGQFVEYSSLAISADAHSAVVGTYVDTGQGSTVRYVDFTSGEVRWTHTTAQNGTISLVAGSIPMSLDLNADGSVAAASLDTGHAVVLRGADAGVLWDYRGAAHTDIMPKYSVRLSRDGSRLVGHSMREMFYARDYLTGAVQVQEGGIDNPLAPGDINPVPVTNTLYPGEYGGSLNFDYSAGQRAISLSEDGQYWIASTVQSPVNHFFRNQLKPFRSYWPKWFSILPSAPVELSGDGAWVAIAGNGAVYLYESAPAEFMVQVKYGETPANPYNDPSLQVGDKPDGDGVAALYSYIIKPGGRAVTAHDAWVGAITDIFGGNTDAPAITAKLGVREVSLPQGEFHQRYVRYLKLDASDLPIPNLAKVDAIYEICTLSSEDPSGGLDTLLSSDSQIQPKVEYGF